MLPGHLFNRIFSFFYILLYCVVNEWRNKSLSLLDAARDDFGWRPVWSFNGNVYAFAGGKKQIIRNLNDIVKIKNSM